MTLLTLTLQLSKISWLPDICRVQGSIIGTVAFPVLTVTLFAAAVALANELIGRTRWSLSIRPQHFGDLGADDDIDRNLQLTNSVGEQTP